MIKLFIIALLLLQSVLFSQGRDNVEQNFNRAVQVLGERTYIENRPLLSSFGGFGTSLLIRSPGVLLSEEAAQGAFVLAVPLHASFAVDTAISFAQMLIDSNNVLVAFLADERLQLPNEGNPHKGLRDLLNLVDIPENWVLCYLDIDEAPGALVLHYKARGYIAPLELIKPLPDLFNSKNIHWSFSDNSDTFYYQGHVKSHEVLSIVWGEEINSFLLTGAAPSGEAGISPEDLAEFLLEYTNSLAFPVLNADRHYSIISFPGKKVFFISEGQKVILLMTVAAVFLFFYLVYSSRKNVIVYYHIRLFFRYFWIFLVFLPYLSLLFMLSGQLYSMLLSFIKPVLNVINNTGTILILLFTALAFFLPSPVLALLRINRRAWFYGFSGVVWVSIGMVFTVFMDFSNILIFLCLFCLVFLGSSLSNPVLVFLCAILIPIFVFDALFIDPGNWLMSIQAAFFTLPVFLLLIRGITLLKKKNREIALKQRLIFIPLLMLIVFGVMIIQILLLPRQNIIPERRYITDEQVTEEVLSLSVNNVLFRDSRIIALELSARGIPIRFNVFLESLNGSSLLPVYSASVPYDRKEEGRVINFSLGEDPPNPLFLEIVLPENFTGRLSADAVYNSWDPSIDPDERPDTQDYLLRVSRSVDL